MTGDSQKVVDVLKNDAGGTIAKVWNEDLMRYVILKKIPLSDIALREVQILKDISHPAIPMLIDSYIEGEIVYMTLEFRKGQTLRELCETKRLTEKQVIDIIRQLASIMFYLHVEAKVIHRDIKLENVLIDENFNVSLIDFGFADYLTENMTERLGSPAYCSPELVLGKPYGASTDIWSLGVLAYYLLERTFPFEGETIETVFHAICHKQAPISRMNASAKCKMFLTRLLSKDPNGRLTIEQVMENPWLTMTPHIKSMAGGNMCFMYRKSDPVFRPCVQRLVLGRILI